MIDFRSDNTGRAAPEILDALIRANHGTALGYGGDDYTATLQRRFSELFETGVRVFPVKYRSARSPGRSHKQRRIASRGRIRPRRTPPLPPSSRWG